MGARTWNPESCGDYVTFAVDAATDDRLALYYDHTGALVALTSSKAGGCLAGPSSFAAPTCTSMLVGSCTPH
jgi:hypothetical protein